MDARERWQALQKHLTEARRSLEAGDRASALAAVDAALAIDPDFLAAHSLRDRVLQANQPAPARVVGPAAGLAQIEQRARRRRVDRRVDAAREALSRGRLQDAVAALEEVAELDPNLPELAELTAEVETMRRSLGASRPGRWVVAAAAFAAVVFAATWLHEAGELVSRPLTAASPILLPPDRTGDAAMADAVASGEMPAATAGDAPVQNMVLAASDRDRLAERAAVSGSVAARDPVITAPAPPGKSVAAVYTPPIQSPAAEVPAASSRLPVPVEVPAFAPEAVPASAPAPASVPPPPAVVPAASRPVTAAVRPDDRVLVEQVLQRYRSAYDGLDAGSARAVWPAVNEGALARAFDGLASQHLTFDACEVRLSGESADATCRGTARYVPKVGSRDPRVEPRTWVFTLRKAGSAWQIESAKAQ